MGLSVATSATGNAPPAHSPHAFHRMHNDRFRVYLRRVWMLKRLSRHKATPREDEVHTKKLDEAICDVVRGRTYAVTNGQPPLAAVILVDGSFHELRDTLKCNVMHRFRMETSWRVEAAVVFVTLVTISGRGSPNGSRRCGSIGLSPIAMSTTPALSFSLEPQQSI